MIAAAFISLTVGHIFMMIGGLLLFLLCIGAEILFAKDGGGQYQGAMALFGIFFLVGMCVVWPHMDSVNSRHHAQVFRDLPHEYGTGFVVVDNSVQSHWVQFRFRTCGPKTFQYDNIRLFHGHYWLAITVVQKDKDGQSYTTYQRLLPSKLAGVCQTATEVA